VKKQLEYFVFKDIPACFALILAAHRVIHSAANTAWLCVPSADRL